MPRMFSLERIRAWFYRGPTFLGVQPYKRNGYQSPTVTAILWIYAFAVRNVTMAGVIVLLCAGLVTLYSMFTLMMPIHILAFAVLGIFALDMIIGYFMRPHVVIHRSLPERMGVGAVHTVRYSLSNRSKSPALDILLDGLPLPRGLRFPNGRAFIREMGPGQTVQVSAEIQARRRGRYVVPAARADSPFPFHLWRWGVMGEAPRVITVYPHFTPLRRFLLSAGMRYQAGGIALSSAIGESMEFLGTRPFRSGDSLKHIHWRSWARTGYPVVKEFREEYLCRTALIVDTHRPAPFFWERFLRLPDRPLDAVASLAAAIADHLAHSDYIVDLFAAGPDIYRFRGGRSLGFLENILDILACLQPNSGEPFAEFADELIQEVAMISSAVLLLLDWNPIRQRVISELRASGVTVRVFLIAGPGPLPPELPEFVEIVSVNDILDGHIEEL